MKKIKKQHDSPTFYFIAILFIILVFSAVYALVQIVNTPSAAPVGQPTDRLKSDYMLMLTQCLMSLAVLSLLSLAIRKWKIPLSNSSRIWIYVHIFLTIFLGDVLGFYYSVPHWDSILHLFSGMALVNIGFNVMDVQNNKQIDVPFSAFFIAFFAFCFSLSAGCLWEIYEYTCDSLLGLNMQKYMTESGEALVGAAALRDTMKDIVIDTVAAAIMSCIGYIYLTMKRKHRSLDDTPV